MAKILIIGCGSIGYELALTLTKAGHIVTGLKRNPPETDVPSLRFIRADISSSTDLHTLPTDFDYVFFIVSANSRDESSYHNIYSTGIDNLLAHFAKTGTQAPWLFVSSTSVYGQTQGEWVDENSITIPSKRASQLIVEAEQKLFTANPANVVVRFSGIYGPGREYLLRMAKQAPAIQQDPPYYTNRIHQSDCVGVLVFLLNQRLKGLPLDQCYLASDDAPATMWEVISWLAEAMQCSPPTIKVANLTNDQNKRCRNDRLKSLGYQFIYPDYKTGYSELIACL